MRNFTKTGGRPASGSRPSESRPSAPAASLEGEHLEYLRRRGAPWGEPPVAGAAAPPGGARRRARIVDFWPGGALDTYRLRSRRRARISLSCLKISLSEAEHTRSRHNKNPLCSQAYRAPNRKQD